MEAFSGNVELFSSDFQLSERMQATIIDYFQELDFQKAQILWALKHVVCGFSDNSCKNTVDLFKKNVFGQ